MAGAFRTGRRSDAGRRRQLRQGYGRVQGPGLDQLQSASLQDRVNYAGKGKNKGGGDFGLGKDLAGAKGYIDDYNLNPSLGSLDASRAPETTALINNANSLYNQYSQRDPNQAAYLSTLEGQQNGFTDTESTAFREEAESGLESQLATALRGLGISNAGRGVMGGAAQAGAIDLYGQRAGAQRGVERDLIAQNLALKESRQQRLGDFLTNLVNDEASRSRGALADLTGVTTGAQASETAANVFNLGQKEKELGVYTSNLLGLAGARGNRRATRQAQRLAKAQAAAEGQRLGAFNDQMARAASANGSVGGGI